MTLNFLNSIKSEVYAMEYPGYGFYNGTPSSQQILQDSLLFFDYVNKVEKIPMENIIIFGRSIGTGPATFVASKRNPAALILLSPFSSIKELILSYFGKIKSLVSFLISERFNNGVEIVNVKCPIYLVHGERDDVIPISHSRILIEKNKNIVYKFPKNMTHNEFDLMSDILEPIKIFLQKCLK